MKRHDPTNEKNCITMIAEFIVIFCFALIVGSLCAWTFFLSPEWMR